MTRKTERLTGEITRRTALKAGAAVASGLAVGGTAVGTAGANRSSTTRVFLMDQFVRAADDTDPGSPTPDPQDLLVERRQGHPVDDGDVVGLDGTHQLRWGEYSAIQGVATVECVAGGTDVTMKLTGLVPGALYTVWVVVYESPGFIDTRELGGKFGFRALDNMIGFGPLGAQDGSENAFRPTGGTATIEMTHPTVPLANLFVDEFEAQCLLDEYEAQLTAVFHLDDETHGSVPEPAPGAGTIVEQPGFAFGTGV